MTEQTEQAAPRVVEGWTTYTLYNGEVKLGFDEKGKMTGRRHTYWLKVPKSDLHPRGIQLIPGVTGISGLLTEAASGLSPWAAGLAVEKLRALGYKLDGEEISADHKREAVAAHTEFRDTAAVKGTDVHAMFERIFKYPDQITAEEKAGKVYKVAAATMDFLLAEGIDIVEVESKIFSREHKYAGTLDIKARKKATHERLCIVDVKTSKAFRVSHAMQIASYARADSEEHGVAYTDGGVILASNKPKLKWLSDEMQMPGEEALARCFNAFLGLLAVKTSIPNFANFGRSY